MKQLLYIVICVGIVTGTPSLEVDDFILTASNVFNMTHNRQSVLNWEITRRNLKSYFTSKRVACLHISHGYIYSYHNATRPFRIAGKGNLLSTVNGKSFHARCLYMTNINFHVRKKWKPRVREDKHGSLGIAIECYISRSPSGQELCHKLLHTPQKVTIRIQPTSPGNSTIYDDVSPLQTTVITTPVRSKYVHMSREKYTRFRDANVVLTVQTFRNNISGPSLYMFMRYYLSLGWPVMVYDRYGLHSDVMEEFRSLPEVLYHNGSFFERLFPSTFNSKAVTEQDTVFKLWHFSAAGSSDRPKNVNIIMEEWEMYNQDDDKRATVDMAAAHYRQLVKSFFYVDRDEFLFCPPGKHDINSQTLFQQNFVNMYMPHADELLLPRINIASLVHNNNARTIDGNSPRDASEGVLTADLERCLTVGYEQRSMRNLWGCYSQAWVPKTKSKGIYPPDSCPFHELHKPCLRCRCNTVDLTYMSKCHVMHLSNGVDTKYTPPSEYYINKTMPRLDMMNMWRGQ